MGVLLVRRVPKRPDTPAVAVEERPEDGADGGGVAREPGGLKGAAESDAPPVMARTSLLVGGFDTLRSLPARSGYKLPTEVQVPTDLPGLLTVPACIVEAPRGLMVPVPCTFPE